MQDVGLAFINMGWVYLLHPAHFLYKSVRGIKMLKIEMLSEFVNRIEYGTQLEMLIQMRNKTVSSDSERAILRNTKLPNSAQEAKLMNSYGYVPVLNTVDINGVADRRMYFTGYDLLSDVLTSRGVKLNSLKGTNASVTRGIGRGCYDVMEGQWVSYLRLNTILAGFDLRLQVVLVPVSYQIFQSYKEAVTKVNRVASLYQDGKNREIPIKDGLYAKVGGTEEKADPVKYDREAVHPANLQHVILGKRLRDNLERFFVKENDSVLSQFIKLPLTSLEDFIILCDDKGGRVKYTVQFDKSVILPDASGTGCHDVNSVKDVIAFVGCNVYGKEWIDAIDLQSKDVYLGKRQMRLRGLDQFAGRYHCKVKISIVG